MDLKDKLDLIWKYSLLVIILFSLIYFHSNVGKLCGYGNHSKGHYGQRAMGSGGHMGMGHGKQIKVEKQIIDGDTTLVVWVDGKKIDHPKEYLAKHGCSEHGGACIGHGDMKKMKMMKMEVKE